MDKIKINLESVKSFFEKLKIKSSDIINNFPSLIGSEKLTGVQLIGSYFTDYFNAVNKYSKYLESLAKEVETYHNVLAYNIEGYVIPVVQTEGNHNNNDDDNGGSDNEIITPPPGEIVLPPNAILESGYSTMGVYVPIGQINAVLAALLSKYGLTLGDLYSGNYNHILTSILSQAGNLSVYIATLTEMEALKIQSYLNSNPNSPLFSNVNLFLTCLSKYLNVDLNKLLTNEEFATKIKSALVDHRESLLKLDTLNKETSVKVQSELKNIILEDNKDKVIDDITREMLKDHLTEVAKHNNISLEKLLTDEKYADLAKDALDAFLKKILYNEEAAFPSRVELENIAIENGTNLDDILDGNNNDLVTDIIENTNDNNVTNDLINNMEDGALQDYVNEVVFENKYPSVINNPVIKGVVAAVTKYRSYILNPESKPLEEVTPDETPIVDEKVKEEVKEIFSNDDYAPKIKEVVTKNNTFNWLGLLPLAGLGLIPVVAAVKKKEDEKISRGEGVEARRGILDENFTYFADSNSVTEDSLIDGTNFELLTIYLSQLDSIIAVLNVLSIMKDDLLQKYIKELYELKYEHIWSKNSLILKLMFIELYITSEKQAINIDTLLSSSNYVVWIKTSVVDILKRYLKFEEDIKFNGGLSSFINNIINKTIPIKDEYLNLLSEYVNKNSSKLGLDTNMYLEKSLDNENKLKIFAIISFGDGIKNISFGFINALSLIDTENKTYDNINNTNQIDEMILVDSGYPLLLFNSTEDQIYKAIGRILEKYNLKKEDLFNGNKESFLEQLVDRSTALTITLTLLLELNPKNIQQFLYKRLVNNSKNKFVLVIIKFLEYLAKSENTNVETLLSDIKYAELIKESLINFKKSVINLYALIKKDDNTLNSEINNIFFMEDPSTFGIDKITTSMIKAFLTDSSTKENIGLNSLLDIKNIQMLKKYMNTLINNLMFIKLQSFEDNSEEKLEIKNPTLSPKSFEDNKKSILDKLKLVFTNQTNIDPLLKNKIKKYIEFLSKESNNTFDDYLQSTEFSNFLNINFENSNIMILIYEYMKTPLNYSFEINEKINSLAVEKSLSTDEFKSIKGVSFIVQSIIKENNIIFTLETLLDLNTDVYSEAMKQLIIVKENTNINKVFNYVDMFLKRPKESSLGEYLNSNQKTIKLFILKILLMLLIMIFISKQNEEKEEVI